jgi:hypothetical protein
MDIYSIAYIDVFRCGNMTFTTASKTIGKKASSGASQGLVFDYGIPLLGAGLGYALGDVFKIGNRISNFLSKRFSKAGKSLPADFAERVVIYTSILYGLLGVSLFVKIGGMIGKTIGAFLVGCAVSMYGASGTP